MSAQKKRQKIAAAYNKKLCILFIILIFGK